MIWGYRHFKKPPYGWMTDDDGEKHGSCAKRYRFLKLQTVAIVRREDWPAYPFRAYRRGLGWAVMKVSGRAILQTQLWLPSLQWKQVLSPIGSKMELILERLFGLWSSPFPPLPKWSSERTATVVNHQRRHQPCWSNHHDQSQMGPAAHRMLPAHASMFSHMIESSAV